MVDVVVAFLIVLIKKSGYSRAYAKMYGVSSECSSTNINLTSVSLKQKA